MFVRTYNKKLKDCSIVSHAYLVKNSWNSVKKKTQQKIVACLGKVEDLPHSGVIEEIVTALDKFAKRQGFVALSKGIVVSDLSSRDFCRKTYDWGNLILASHFLKSFSFTDIIADCLKKNIEKKVGLEKVTATLTALLAYQLKDKTTASERKTFLWYKKKTFLPNKQPLLKDDFYRTLDFLIKNKNEIEKQYYEKNKNLFNRGLELVLFDTTSIYYWGEKGEAAKKRKANLKDSSSLPALLNYGYSKDKRSDLKQLMVGVLMAEDLAGNPVPVAHETFPGNQVDLVSFPEIISKVKKKYKVKRIIFIADKGVVSEDNLRKLEGQEMEYILGVRIRKLPPALNKALILNIQKEDMKKIKDNLYAKEFKMKDLLGKGKEGKKIIDELATLIYKNLDFYKSRTGREKKDKEDIRKRVLKRRYFICFNPFVAEENKIKRKYFKEIIKNKIKYTKDKQWIVKNGYKKYLKFPEKLNPQLDEEKLNQESNFDGKWILITNSQTVTPDLATIRYKSLRFVEQGFKDLKSLIKVRPIFHFKERRIKAHIFVSFLALILKWYLYQKLDPTSQTTGRRFIEEINDLKAAEVDKKHQIFVRTEINPKLQKEMKTLGLKIPPKVILDKRPVKKQWKKQVGRPRKQPHPNQQKLI